MDFLIRNKSLIDITKCGVSRTKMKKTKKFFIYHLFLLSLGPRELGHNNIEFCFLGLIPSNNFGV